MPLDWTLHPALEIPSQDEMLEMGPETLLDVKTIISPEEVDALAAYVVPADAWYLIPADKLTSKSVYLSPLDDSSVGKYETWRDAWNVFA